MSLDSARAGRSRGGWARRMVPAGATAGMFAALLGAEAWRTSRRSYLRGEQAPVVRGEYGDTGDARPGDTARPGEPARPGDTAPLRLLMAGDSTAAGVGATSVDATVGGQLAAALAKETGRRVVLDSVAVSGARAADVAAQARAAVAQRPDLVVMLIGANDATHRSGSRAVRRDLGVAVHTLREHGVGVVVGSCPDLGAARNFDQPLRAVVGWLGRRIARAEAAAVVAAGGSTVPLALLTGPSFRADPTHLSADLFHPSDRGYRLWAKVLLPALLDAAARRG